ncbi:BTAD domain-containing putative transcriptional regulator [Actinomadura nitritigenes]|uniref:Winged helix-turn-helix domain-containing protein n=1 Tax=Actinomadura nitritigenes TaxID=134602 RepID=A0ABS3QVP9_9ACTN|nr:BTAD domain-containing putative transcriptional regulator [Actinomadura nitritigenes]MBO2438056.1 winged helix-turn-helix domain-containing protein [Actinomadura nitritigenes]
MRFGVLGPLMVWDEGGEPVRVREAKVRALLAALLIREGRPVSTDRLIDELWGGSPPGNAANALQAKVSQLRRAIGRERVVYQPPGYRLGLADGDEIDADVHRSLVARARRAGDPQDRAALLAEARGLWRGSAYTDFADEEFARVAARRLDDEYLNLLEDLAEARLETGDHARVAEELTELVALHPLRERLRGVQMTALYRAGRQSEALVSYTELRERLAEDLGVDPGPETAALHEAILRQDLSLTARAPAPPSSPAPPPAPTAPGGNLPAPLTSLIGRDRLLDEVERLVRTTRLVTLTGPGGVGKTRLAVAAADRLAATLPDGVWLVELAAHRGGVTDLAQVIVTTLGIRDSAPSGLPGTGPQPPDQRLAGFLRDRHLLLVLDNCEHVVEPAADLVADLLRAAPGVRVLATSRENLALEGEHLRPVDCLDLPDAMELFTARAAAACPGFTLDGTTREPVAEICRRLDGLPLALELAAARVHALGVAALAGRLIDRFRLLASTRRGVPARQRTLRAVIDWSWELLGDRERAVLRRLAVHRDGCSLGAAVAVCADGGLSEDEVPDLVVRLVDRSLVNVVDGPAGRRLRLLESVAAYALEQLAEAHESEVLRTRHLEYYLRLAEETESGGGTRGYRLDHLDAESTNLRAALDEAIRLEAMDEAVRLATVLAGWWLRRGRLNEARRALSGIRAAIPSAPEPRLLDDAFTLLTGGRPDGPPPRPTEIADPRRRGRAVWLYAYALFHGGDPANASEFAGQARVLCTAAGDRWGVAAVDALQAMVALVTGDLETLGRAALRALGAFRELGDRWGELQALTPLAALAEIRADYAAATDHRQAGLRIASELGLAAAMCDHLSGLGRLALLARDWERAGELHETARTSAREHGYVYGEVHALMGLALGARRSGDLDAAESWVLYVNDTYGDISSQAGAHLRCSELGFTAELRGDAALAGARHREGWEIAKAIGDPRAQALSLEGLAGAVSLAGDAGRARDAAVLLGAADTARRSVNTPLPSEERFDVDRITERAMATLNDAAFADAFREGAALTAEQAVARHS